MNFLLFSDNFDIEPLKCTLIIIIMKHSNFKFSLKKELFKLQKNGGNKNI